MVLRQIGDLFCHLPLGIAGIVLPVHQDLPGGFLLSHDAFQQRALARAVLAQDAEDAASVQGEGDVPQDHPADVVAEAQVF